MTNEYKVYAVRPIVSIGMPVVITTVCSENDVEWFGEYFVLIPIEESPFIYQPFSIKLGAGVENEIKFDKEDVLKDAIKRAEEKIVNIIYKNEVDAGRQPYLTYPEIKEDNRNLLINYWAKGDVCHTQLNKVKKHTNCSSLNYFLELVCRNGK